MKIKHYGRYNVSKHREIKGSDKYITLDISLKFDSMDKIKITYSESKDNLERSVKGLINFSADEGTNFFPRQSSKKNAKLLEFI